MNAIVRILIPFDFTAVAENALKYAQAFCGENSQTEILICYVSNKESHQSKDEEMALYKRQSALPGYVKLSSLVTQGPFVDTLLKAKTDFNADMIIMGTKGAGVTSAKAISNTTSITLNADCPVLVIPEKCRDFKIENITLAVGPDKIEDPSVLSTLLVIARKFDAMIHVLTVYEKEDEGFFEESINEPTLKYYFEKYYSFSSAALGADIGEQIQKYDKEHGIDLLALIPRNHAESQAPTEGKLTKFFTLQSDIPLLTMNH